MAVLYWRVGELGMQVDEIIVAVSTWLITLATLLGTVLAIITIFPMERLRFSKIEVRKTLEEICERAKIGELRYNFTEKDYSNARKSLQSLIAKYSIKRAEYTQICNKVQSEITFINSFIYAVCLFILSSGGLLLGLIMFKLYSAIGIDGSIIITSFLLIIGMAFCIEPIRGLIDFLMPNNDFSDFPPVNALFSYQDISWGKISGRDISLYKTLPSNLPMRIFGFMTYVQVSTIDKNLNVFSFHIPRNYLNGIKCLDITLIIRKLVEGNQVIWKKHFFKLNTNKPTFDFGDECTFCLSESEKYQNVEFIELNIPEYNLNYAYIKPYRSIFKNSVFVCIDNDVRLQNNFHFDFSKMTPMEYYRCVKEKDVSGTESAENFEFMRDVYNWAKQWYMKTMIK